MNHSETNAFDKKVLPEPKRLVIGGSLPSQSLYRPSPLPRPEARGPPISVVDDTAVSQRYAQIARELLSSFPSSYPSLNPRGLKLTGRGPVAAGGFADIWEATYEGRKVVLKTYRCYFSFDISEVVARFSNEVLACSMLRHEGVNVVPFVGVYSTTAHPFGIVYEYMVNFDLKQHLRKEPNVGGLKLLTGIAQMLNRMHDLGIIHRGFNTANILIDKDGTPRIAGLGNVYILHGSRAWTPEGYASTNRLRGSQVPELAEPGLSPDVTGRANPTKAGDMHAFGIMAFEILTGGPPFSGMHEAAAMCSMLKGDRPPRPDHGRITDVMWHMIDKCWDNEASQGMSVREVVHLLETELRRGSDL